MSTNQATQPVPQHSQYIKCVAVGDGAVGKFKFFFFILIFKTIIFVKEKRVCSTRTQLLSFHGIMSQLYLTTMQ